MNIFDTLTSAVEDALAALVAEGVLPDGLDLSHVAVEPPRDSSHGDAATNAAMVLAKPAAKKPREIAEALLPKLLENRVISTAEIAGPGFLNLRLSGVVWEDVLRAVLTAGPAYGDSQLGHGALVNVEYVSANPTGPMHMGHCRGAVFGDALAALLEKAGYGVTREYYINDAGSQVDTLARSVHLRYREALGEDIGEIPEGFYPGDYLKAVGESVAEADGDKWRSAPEDSWLGVFKRRAADAMMDTIRNDLAALNIHHAVFASEQDLHDRGAVDHSLKTLQSRDLVYEGVLEPPKGKTPDDWEPRPQTLFKASQFGDDTDRPLKKSDGSWTYFAADIAYHLDKFERGFRHMINVWGADHGGYVKRMQAAVKAMTGGEADLDVKLVQMVRLFRGGEPVKMSKRAGSFVTLREVVEEVGRDVVRFMMLIRKNDAPLDFDFEKVLEQSRDNPVFYVQYAHARCCSVRRNAAQEVPELATEDGALAVGGFAGLTDRDELAVIRKLAEWPRTVETAAQAHEPHRIAFYLFDLAALYHSLWNRGKEDAGLRFLLPGNLEISRQRLALNAAVQHVIASGLAVMGVNPVEEMR